MASGGKLILVSKEQLRPTYGTERWKIDEEALQNLLDDFPDEFHNGRDGEPPDEVVPDENEEIHVPVFEADADDLGVEEYTPSLPPEGDGQRPDELPAHENSSPSAPSVGTNTTHPHPSMREDRAPGTPIHGLLRRPEPLPEAIPIDDPHFDEEMALPPPEVAEPVEKKARLEEPDEPEDNHYPANERLPVYDTELYSEPRGALWGVRMRLQVKGNDAVRWVAQTRKQQKALEKEIPWRLIPEEERQGYADALQKEWDTWTKYQAVEVISLEASKYVEDHTDPARILDSRVCLPLDGSETQGTHRVPRRQRPGPSHFEEGCIYYDSIGSTAHPPDLRLPRWLVPVQLRHHWSFSSGRPVTGKQEGAFVPSPTSRRTSWTPTWSTAPGGARHLWPCEQPSPFLATLEGHTPHHGLRAVALGPRCVHVLPPGPSYFGFGSPRG